MLKSILFVSLSFVLTFSILGPSFLKLYNSDLEAIVLVETSEKEQQNKTGSEIDDIKILKLSHSDARFAVYHNGKLLSDCHQDISSGDYLEIQLPPPRYSV